MYARALRRAAALTAPEGVVVAVAALFWLWRDLHTPAAGFLRVFPAVVLAAGILLAWRFGRPRVLLTFVILALGERALHHVPRPGPVYDLLGIVLPANLVVLSFLKPRAIVSVSTGAALGVVAVEAVVAMVLRDPAFGNLARLMGMNLPGPTGAVTAVGLPAAVVMLAAGAVFVIRTTLRPNALGRGMLWALIAMAVGLHLAAAPPPTLPPGVLPPPPSPVAPWSYWFGIAGLSMVVATIEMSHALAFRDALTGLPARRAFDEALTRLGGAYTIAMVDVDHFKAVNDTHGHDVGDQVLRKVAAELERVGGGGRVYRYGGEEFAVVFPGRDAEAVRPHLDALRESIGGAAFVIRAPDRPARRPEPPPRRRRRGTRSLDVTVSIGYADQTAAGDDVEADGPAAVVEAADRALYRAKRQGRDRVEGRRARRQRDRDA